MSALTVEGRGESIGGAYWLGSWPFQGSLNTLSQFDPLPYLPLSPKYTHNRSLAGLKVAQPPLPRSSVQRVETMFREQKQDQAGRKAVLGGWLKLPLPRKPGPSRLLGSHSYPGFVCLAPGRTLPAQASKATTS